MKNRSALWSVTSLLGLTLCCASCFASSGKHYLALRTRSNWSSGLTYSAVQQNPTLYAGHVLELRGVVGGQAGSPGNLIVMLNMANEQAVTLNIPMKEASTLQGYINPHICALVRVGSDIAGNVAQLDVLAIAHEDEVAEIERAQAATMRYAVARRQARESVRPARGGYERLPALRGKAAQLAAFYKPYLPAGMRSWFGAYYNFIQRCNPRLGANETARITCDLLRFANHYHVNPVLVVSMILAESHFNPSATSRVGAMGLGQLMPGTARMLGVSNAYDPEQNLAGSIAYLCGRLNTFGGGYNWQQVCLALAAYNAGTGAVRRYHGIPPYRQTRAYVRRVIGYYRELSGQ